MKLIRKAKKSVFERLPLSAASNRQLNKIAVWTIIKDIFSESASGIVIAGFGEKENFPTLISYDVDGVVNNKLKYRIGNEDSITIENNATIFPFGQKEMVFTFMEGIDPALGRYFEGYLSELFSKYPGMIADSISKLRKTENKDLMRNLKKMSANILKDFQDKLSDYKQKKHISPIIDAVAALPKDELAAMAESLVNLTSFKRRITLDAETVGGPIDVAVISKGDGFVWIKRKHYFKPDLNPHFMIKYYR